MKELHMVPLYGSWFSYETSAHGSIVKPCLIQALYHSSKLHIIYT